MYWRSKFKRNADLCKALGIPFGFYWYSYALDVNGARQEATKNAVRIAIVDGRTIPHEVVCKQGATTVIIKPASAGTGLVAGGAVRSVLDIAGVKDVMSKSLGSRKKINVARATISALQSVKTIEQVCAERGKTKEEILG